MVRCMFSIRSRNVLNDLGLDMTLDKCLFHELILVKYIERKSLASLNVICTNL